MARKLVDILRSGYVPGSEGDRAFAALHRVERWDDPAGNGDEVFNASNIKHAGLKPIPKPRFSDDLKEKTIDEKHIGFKKLEGKLGHQSGIRNPGALAAVIGRKKYGAEGMAAKSHHEGVDLAEGEVVSMPT